jgi:hypothetical protein
MRLLSGHVKRKRMLSALHELPENLHNAYDDVMDRISHQDHARKTIAVMALTWIVYAKELLHSDALLHAIEVGLDPETTNIDNDDLIGIDLLLSSCAGLVIMNNEDGIIQLVHYTTQDYLEMRFQRVDANTSIAKTCLAYFRLDVFSESLESEDVLKGLMKKYRLSGYAAKYWGHHAYEGREEDLEQAILSTLCTRRKRDMIDRIEDLRQYSRIQFSSLFSLLHLISMYGLSRTCATVISRDVVLSDLIEITSK